ncbi:MAG TPA: SRPBCC family protein [Caulobacteraceae bacterium]|jgi:uncharacterized protein YndB with AHSA1/START domain|nr:SRPBCC family protein [Caulobacteraceae bacterium]
MSVAPIRIRVATTAPLPKAFAVFTSRMGDWWPQGRTIGAKPHVAIVIEPHDGGRWFERDAEGTETLWGEVIAYEPPHRLLLAWRLDAKFTYDPDLLTEVELTFTATDTGGAAVTLEHRNLERLGVDAARLAGRMEGGWGGFLREFISLADTA